MKVYYSDGIYYLSDKSDGMFKRLKITKENFDKLNDNPFDKQLASQLLEGAKKAGSPNYYQVKI